MYNNMLYRHLIGQAFQHFGICLVTHTNLHVFQLNLKCGFITLISPKKIGLELGQVHGTTCHFGSCCSVHAFMENL